MATLDNAWPTFVKQHSRRQGWADGRSLLVSFQPAGVIAALPFQRYWFALWVAQGSVYSGWQGEGVVFLQAPPTNH